MMGFVDDIKRVLASAEFNDGRNEFFENSISAITGDLVALKKVAEFIIKSPIFIRECLFWEKFTLFLKGTFQEDDDPIKLAAVFSNNEEKEEYARRIISIIDSIDATTKVIYVVNLTRALLTGLICKTDYYRLCNAVRNNIEEDLLFLSQNINKKLTENNIQIEFLKNNGLIVQTIISGNNDEDDEKYAFTPFAKMLDKFGLDYGNEKKYDYSVPTQGLIDQNQPTTNVGKVVANWG